MLFTQIVRIREGQTGQTTKTKDVSDSVEPLVRQLFAHECFELFARQMVFLLVVFLFEFVISERVFLAPLVTQAITGEVFDAIEQIDRSIMFAVVSYLQKRIEPVDKLVTDGRKQ